MSEPAVDDETFQHLKATVERFVAERLVPNEMRLEIEDEVPEEIVAEMRELGLLGLTIPPECGGIGLTASQESQLAMIFGGAALALRSLLATNIGLGARGACVAHGAAGAWRVLDHHGLLQVACHALDDDARQHIGRATRSERHHDGDGPVGIGGLRGQAR